MIRWTRHRTVMAAVLAGAIGGGCAHDPGVAVIQAPIALHAGPGSGFRLANVRTIYLAVFTQNTEAQPLLDRLTEVVASELRAAGPVDVIVLVDHGLECPPCSDWADVCSAYQLPLEAADPFGVVALCELEELDPYVPIRVGLSLSVRRIEDGQTLASAQGIWAGAEEPLTPPQSFHWPWRRAPAVPPIELQWDDRVESGSCADVMRRAARDCVQTVLNFRSTAAPGPATLGSAEVPALGPALPPLEPSESVESIPPAPDLSP